jgi:hypothetical protein
MGGSLGEMLRMNVIYVYKGVLTCDACEAMLVGNAY